MDKLDKITGIKSKHAEGKLKECIESCTEESLTKARKQLDEEPVSEELDEEIRIWQNYFGGNDDVKRELIIQIARHFANWQKKLDAKYREENNICCMPFDDIDAARVAAYEQGKMDMKEQMMEGAVDGTTKFVNTGGDDPFVKFICPDLDSSEFRLNQRVKVLILK